MIVATANNKKRVRIKRREHSPSFFKPYNTKQGNKGSFKLFEPLPALPAQENRTTTPTADMTPDNDTMQYSSIRHVVAAL